MSKHILLYGPPHSGKSNLARAIAMAMAEGGLVNLYTAETYDCFEPEIKSGQIRLWNIADREWPWEVMERAAMKGEWPLDPSDPASPIGPDPKFKDVRVRIWEGSTTISELMLGAAKRGGLAARVGRGEQVGLVKKEIVSFVDGKTTIGYNSGLHYSYVQRRICDYHDASHALPGHSIWTAHQTTGEDSVLGKPIIGPKAVGSAATEAIPKQFGPVIYLRTVPGKDGAAEYRMYLKRFYETIASTDWDGTKHVDKVPIVATLRAPIEREANIPASLIIDKAGITQLMTLFNLN